MADEEPEVQWAMNFTAGWIGVYDEIYRTRCIKIGEKTGLYKDEVVPRGCTPAYLPKFIEIEVNKREKKIKVTLSNNSFIACSFEDICRPSQPSHVSSKTALLFVVICATILYGGYN